MSKTDSKMDAKQFKKEMAGLKPGDGVALDDKTTYDYGADLNVEGVPLIDPGTGKTVSIRTFIFKMSPDKLKEFKSIEKQTLFNTHAKQIFTILWADGLQPLDGVPPRVIIDRKKCLYHIFVPCEARLNTMWMDKPKNLSETLNTKLDTVKT